jgi:hypothetical protein
MSNDNQTNKLLAHDFMSATYKTKVKRECVNILSITAMNTHSKEYYEELVGLKERLKTMSDKCKKKGIRFSITGFGVHALKKALAELEKEVN